MLKPIKPIAIALLAVVAAACQLDYQNGKTKCSVAGTCPGGFICGSPGAGQSDVCFEISKTQCTPGQYLCSLGNCVASKQACPCSLDLQTDKLNCGACSNVCSGSKTCMSGQCCDPPSAGGTCNLPACGCGTGQVCYPSDLTQGLTCLDSAGLGEGEDCTAASSSTSTGCKAGLGCFAGICRSYCSSDSDCPSIGGARKCKTTVWSSKSTIPGVNVCNRVCDPINPQSPRSPLLSCPPGFGCIGDTNGASDCYKAGTGTSGASCSANTDCAPGHLCVTTKGVSLCRPACSTNTDCPSGSICQALSPPLPAGQFGIGWCTETLGEAVSQQFVAECSKLRDCAPGMLSYDFAEYKECLDRGSLFATWFAALPGISADISLAQACAQAWSSVACSAYLSFDPDACWIPGTLPNSSPCSTGEQCISMFCKHDAWSCGSCAPMPAVGATCATSADCGRGTQCTPDGTCQEPGSENVACSASLPCRSDLACYKGKCTILPNSTGTACDLSAGLDCAWTQNLACSNITKLCVPITWNSAGLACSIADGKDVLCSQHGSCSGVTCTAGPTDHGTCDPSNDLCEWPARCSAEGICMLPTDTGVCK